MINRNNQELLDELRNNDRNGSGRRGLGLISRLTGKRLYHYSYGIDATHRAMNSANADSEYTVEKWWVDVFHREYNLSECVISEKNDSDYYYLMYNGRIVVSTNNGVEVWEVAPEHIVDGKINLSIIGLTKKESKEDEVR